MNISSTAYVTVGFALLHAIPGYGRLNAFCRWLHERGDLPTKVHLKPLKAEKRLIATLEMEAISAIVRFKPPTAHGKPQTRRRPQKGQKAFAWWRIHALACTLLDTGCRVQELLDSKVEDFDFEDLLLTVVGKGDKQRRIPFSVDLRRILFRYRDERGRFGISKNEPLMFPVHEGGTWDQRNALRAFYLLQKRLGLAPVGFHRLRHTFATKYLRRGGDVVRLSRTLGHTQITTTMRYLHLLTEDLSAAHPRISLLGYLYTPTSLGKLSLRTVRRVTRTDPGIRYLRFGSN